MHDILLCRVSSLAEFNQGKVNNCCTSTLQCSIYFPLIHRLAAPGSHELRALDSEVHAIAVSFLEAQVYQYTNFKYTSVLDRTLFQSLVLPLPHEAFGVLYA